MTVPQFAVVGHPNKGKSSLVATLAHDEGVAVGSLPGTTTRCQRFPMKVDEKELYVLVDTPGFQRPYQLLRRLEALGLPASQRAEAISSFILEDDSIRSFPDECELLLPITQGAGILYVVDGSVPYSTEYEAEMEILRWTGQPRMAIINPISSTHFVEAWKSALNQYFGIVKVIDAAHAPFAKRLELLRAFGELKEDWQQPLRQACTALESNFIYKRQQAARCIAAALIEMLASTAQLDISPNTPTESVREKLENQLAAKLRSEEKKVRTQVAQIYAQSKAELSETKVTLLEEDILSEKSLRVFGLSKSQIVTLGTLSGATAGGLLDASVGGSSFFLGAIAGAGLGAVSSLIGAERLYTQKILALPLGYTRCVLRLADNSKLAHTLLGRARLHRYVVAERAHGQRTRAQLEDYSQLPEFSHSLIRNIEQCFNDIRKNRDVISVQMRLAALLMECFAADDEQTVERHL
jgi:hypothetical protein